MQIAFRIAAPIRPIRSFLAVVFIIWAFSGKGYSQTVAAPSIAVPNSVPRAPGPTAAVPSVTPLHTLQQHFADLRFGMFIHFSIPTFMDQDWADPEASPSLFDPKRLDCSQWARAAKSAGMSYGCLTTKHHSGFCIWDTKTTDYNVMHSPLKRDVVREYVDAFRAQGLKTMLYYSILDTHHRLRPGWITRQQVEMIKAQLTELLTNYGEITALIIDGWDAPWSRISYDDVPFEDIYTLVKTLQPNCLLMDLNSAKYPAGALMYTDIKSYEQNAGQHISRENNRLPALSCLPLQSSWFWKTSFPTDKLKDPSLLIREDIVPFNNAWCNFILNVAPNRDGLMDDNALASLKEIGDHWKNAGAVSPLPETEAPVISSNIAKKQPSESSWSDDMQIMDFANDDNFNTAWESNPAVKAPWYAVLFDRDRPFNTIVITESRAAIRKYRLEYFQNGAWKPIQSTEKGMDGGNPATGGKVVAAENGAAGGNAPVGANASGGSGVANGNAAAKGQRVRILRFARVWGGKVRILIDQFDSPPAIAEFGVYDERR